MDEGKVYDELVSLIYDCVLDESAWLRLLTGLATATGRSEGSLFIWDRGNGQAPRASTISLCAPEVLRDYDEHYSFIDPAQAFMVGRQSGNWYHDVRDYGKASMARDPFYQDFFRTYELGMSSTAKLYEHDGAGVYLSLLTARDAPMPTQAQQQMLERLSTHLRQAALLAGRIQRLELGVAQRELLLEQSATPQWLVDTEGRVVFCNTNAERGMGLLGFPLRLRHGRLVADMLPALPAAIRNACGKSGPARAGWLCVQRTNVELLITPVKAESHCPPALQRPLALVALLENRSRIDLLAELFHFTPAESRLAELIAQGLSPEDCAARLGVSINTVRSQLRSLFRKTNTERQVELVGLLVRLG